MMQQSLRMPSFFNQSRLSRRSTRIHVSKLIEILEFVDDTDHIP